MAFTYIESGKHLIGEKVEGFMNDALVRLCSAAPVSSTSLNELSGNGYFPSAPFFSYNPHTGVIENGYQIVFRPATANWDPITHILVSSGIDAETRGTHEPDDGVDGVFAELNSSITVQSGYSLVIEAGTIKLGLSRIYDGVGAAANFITPGNTEHLFAGSNFVNAVIGLPGTDTGGFGDTKEGGEEVHLKLLTGEPTLTDTKETVPGFPAGVEIVLDRTGSHSTAYFINHSDAVYGPFPSGVTFTHFAIGQTHRLSDDTEAYEDFVDEPFSIYGYDTLSSPIVIPPNQSLFIPKDTILTSQAALT